MSQETKVYLASSALSNEGFDGRKTIIEAVKNGFDGVQLYLDGRYREPAYLEMVVADLKETDLGLVIHLPNEVEGADEEAAKRLVQHFPEAKVLIHYGPADELPEIDGVKVGWENSKTRVFDPDHIAEVWSQVERDMTFAVLDFGRFMYTDGSVTPIVIVDFIREQINKLRPDQDLIHMADKMFWHQPFRDCWTALGRGIARPLVDDLRNYGGIVVFEHEDLQMAIDSLKVMKTEGESGEFSGDVREMKRED